MKRRTALGIDLSGPGARDTYIPLNSLLRRRPPPRARAPAPKLTLIHGKTTLLFSENRTMSPVWLDYKVNGL